MQDRIDKDRLPLTVKGKGIFVVPPVKHVHFLNAGHFFDSPVPRNNLSRRVNRKSGVWQELDNIVQPPFRLVEPH